MYKEDTNLHSGGVLEMDLTLNNKQTISNKFIKVFIAIITGLLFLLPSVVQAESSTPTEPVNRITVANVEGEVAPKVTNADIEGKIERGGSAIYGIIQTVVIYASYIGFAIGILWIIVGFGKSGRTGGIWLMLLSSVAYFLIGYGPEIVAWLGDWFTAL